MHLHSDATACAVCLNLGTPVCPICLNFGTLISPSRPKVLHISKRRLSEFQGAEKNWCSFCAILLRLFETMSLINDSGCIDGTILRGGARLHISFDSPSSEHIYYSFDIYQSLDSTVSSPFLMTFPNLRDLAANADSEECFAFAKSCLDHCLENHEICCEFGGASLPSRTISLGPDNSSLKLMEHPKGTRANYATLSYCWGTAIQLRQQRSTLSLWKMRLLWESLPPVFQNAIMVTRKLGVIYLWIDALCIIQDSPEDWQTESSRMAEIYAGSHFTMAAGLSRSCMMPFLSPRPEYASPITIKVGENSGIPNRRKPRSSLGFGSDQPLP